MTIDQPTSLSAQHPAPPCLSCSGRIERLLVFVVVQIQIEIQIQIQIQILLRKDGEVAGTSGRGIAVFTSGGDSQGMNAAVRAVVRYCICIVVLYLQSKSS